MAESDNKWGTIEGMWKTLAPFKAPIAEDAPLSENVEDRRDPEKMLELIMRSVNHLPAPQMSNESNPLLDQLKSAIASGRIRGAL